VEVPAEEERREEEEQRRAAQEETRRREEEERRAAEEEEQRREEQEERRRAAEAAIERVLACGASDHCAVLAVSREADVGALKEAYRQLSLLSHPDKCSHPRAKEAFIRIKASFEALCADIEGKHNAAAERAAAERAAAERAAKKAAAEKAAAEKAAAERAFNRRIMRDEMFAERFIEQAFAAHIDNIFESAFSRFEDRLDRLGDDLFDF
jgi:curved DNA-binding protein CbpA